MSGTKYPGGERERCPIHGNGHRLSRGEISEMRRAIDIANSQARKKGKKPKQPNIIRFSCRCNCFHVDVE